MDTTHAASIADRDEDYKRITGVGYHDHNWGTIGMTSVINDWYWARGQAGSVLGYRLLHHRT